MIAGIPSDQVDKYWRHLAPLIKSGVKKTQGFYTAESLLKLIKNTECQLWVQIDGDATVVTITRIIQYPNKRILEILLTTGEGVGGKFDKILNEGWENFKEYAKANECDEIVGVGRKAWTKVIKDKLNIFTGWRYQINGTT